MQLTKRKRTLIIFGIYRVRAWENSPLSLTYWGKVFTSYGIDHQILTIDFNLFSSSEQHSDISCQVTLIQKKRRSSHRGTCSSDQPHIWCAAQVHLDHRDLDNFQPKFPNISNIQPCILSPVNAEGRKAANRGSRLRTVIWIKEFLLVLHLRTHWQTWKEID